MKTKTDTSSGHVQRTKNSLLLILLFFIMALVAQIQIAAIGNWSNPSTWGGNNPLP